MDEDAVLMAIGGFRSDIQNLGREIGELKTALGDNGRTCTGCKQEINTRLSNLELHGAGISQKNAADIILIDGRLGVVEEHCKAESNISTWKNKTLAEIGQIVGTVSGIIGITALIVGWALHFIWTGSGN